MTANLKKRIEKLEQRLSGEGMIVLTQDLDNPDLFHEGDYPEDASGKTYRREELPELEKTCSMLVLIVDK